MSKRGDAALFIFLMFALLAIAGLYVVNKTSGMAYHGLPMQDYPIEASQIPSPDEGGIGGAPPLQDQPGWIKYPMISCQSLCYGKEPGEPVGVPLAGQALRDCLGRCNYAYGTQSYPSDYYPWGEDDVPLGHEPNAFLPHEFIPSGLATDCYMCPCLGMGIDATERGAANRECHNTCGTNTTDMFQGKCGLND